jgi:hypothetical protein
VGNTQVPQHAMEVVENDVSPVDTHFDFDEHYWTIYERQ